MLLLPGLPRDARARQPLRASAPARLLMEWAMSDNDDDNDVEKMAPKVAVQARNSFMPVEGVQVLNFKSAAEDALHEKACKDAACHWCKAARFLRKYKAAFQVVEDGLVGSPHYRNLSEKGKALAKTAWLGKGHRQDGSVSLGCVVCNALQDPRVMPNPFASYRFPAWRLFEASGRPHVLLRHGRTTLHAKAVAKFLGMDEGLLLAVKFGPKRERGGGGGSGRGCVVCFVDEVSACPRRVRDLGGAAVGALPARLGRREARHPRA